MDNDEINNEEENEFGGKFHERDSQAQNDIVKEISDSFLEIGRAHV